MRGACFERKTLQNSNTSAVVEGHDCFEETIVVFFMYMLGRISTRFFVSNFTIIYEKITKSLGILSGKDDIVG